MKVIIAGSRTGADEADVRTAIALSGWGDVISEVVSGAARGVDTWGELYASDFGIPIKKFPYPPNTGKRGGPIRNRQMAEYAQALIAVWDGSSRGTMNMIEEAQRRGLGVFVYNFRTKEGKALT